VRAGPAHAQFFLILFTPLQPWGPTALARRRRRRLAIDAGAVPALCSVLSTGDEEPVSLDVLKALYSLIAPDTTGAGRDARRWPAQQRAHTPLTLGAAQATRAARSSPPAACTPWCGARPPPGAPRWLPGARGSAPGLTRRRAAARPG